MQISKAAHDMASLLLKHHPIPKPKVEEQSQPQLVQPTKKDKYSLDYSKFEMVGVELSKPDKIGARIEDPALAHFAHTHDKRKERELFERPTQEKLDNAQFFKEEGNKAYSTKDYDKAVYMYEKAVIHFDYTFPEDEKQEKRMQQLKEKCHLNLALSQYCLKQYDQALTNLRQVLLINPNNIKAIFRQATIAYDRDDFEKCSSLLQSIVEIENGNQSKEVAILRQNLHKKQADYSAKLRKVASSMLRSDQTSVNQ